MTRRSSATDRSRRHHRENHHAHRQSPEPRRPAAGRRMGPICKPAWRIDQRPASNVDHAKMRQAHDSYREMSLELWPVFDARRAENPVKPQRWFTYLAMGHAAVGDLDRAFEALERAYQGTLGRPDLCAPRSQLRAVAQRSSIQCADQPSRTSLAGNARPRSTQFLHGCRIAS